MIRQVSIIMLLLAGTAIIYAQDSGLANTSISITSPKDLDEVNVQQRLEGTWNDIPDGYELWIAVQARNADRFYFQKKPTMMMNGKWSGTANIGVQSVSNRGLEFDVYAILANETATDTIVEHLERCEENKSWPGLEELPLGTNVYNKVTVIRK
jgi:hypothetical protein